MICDGVLAGSVEEAWFDPAESDFSDEDFQSVPDADVLSLNGFEGSSTSSVAPVNIQRPSSPEKLQRRGNSCTCDSALESDGHLNEAEPVYLDEISSSPGESAGREDGLLDNCGIIPNNCLPCLANTVPTVEKRRSLSSSPPPSARKKAASKLSFKWREGHPNAALLSSKMLLQRPIAGSQVPFCPVEKKMLDSWSHIEPSTFKVRAENYFR
ncbi:unnamed protein product [Ilex paraguariensis]